jgi:hypothetical protein
MAAEKTRESWFFAVMAALLLAFIASIPQLYLVYERGRNWNGSYAYLDTDELAYAAYENALIDGRPRRNDPYNGTDNQDFETLFSIQFVPPYALAFIARLFHLSASATFVLLAPLVIFASVLILFKLSNEITSDAALAIVTSVGVLCFGTLVAQNPADQFLPFLRRYLPAFPFPICLALFLLVWRSLNSRRLIWPIAASLTFVVLIYSYFYLWTAAAAWFICLTALWFMARPAEWRQTTAKIAVIIGPVALGLIPYFWLVSKRASSMDEAQVLELSHLPSLFRTSELVGAAVLLVSGWLIATRKIDWREPRFLFAVSFALAPFAIFNQQVLTGRSLQPFHYGQFITNYMVMIAIFLLFGIVWRRISRAILVSVLIVGLMIGLLQAINRARKTLEASSLFDQKREVSLHVKAKNNNEVVFASDALMNMLIPTDSRNPVLWSRYNYIFGNTDALARKEAFFKYLYYSGFDEERFVQALHSDFTSRVEVFGAERTNPSLTVDHHQINDEDIQAAARDYSTYRARFSYTEAANPRLGYAVVLTNVDLTNLDRWYQRDAGERVGDFVVYRLALK